MQRSTGGVSLALGGLLALALSSASPGSALTITYDLDFEFSNGTPPEGATPWTTITLDDSVGPDTVRVTISNPNLTDQEAVTEFSLNLDPLFDPTQLTLSVVSAGDVDRPSNLRTRQQ